MQAISSIGNCPVCGDEMWLMKTSSNKRIVKCMDDHCPKKFCYPVPHKGKLENSHIICPLEKVPIFAVIPLLHLKQGAIKHDTHGIYFWAKNPCFTCSKAHSCGELKDAQEDFLPEAPSDLVDTPAAKSKAIQIKKP